ncbi:MAG TPA: hypothetical protein VFA20_31390 [Myxococcaceae bacterium]|nr:hypothetical protein [Myxococcaceae bacterium]
MLSLIRVACWCAVLATVCSPTLARAAGPDPEPSPSDPAAAAPEKKEPDPEKKGPDKKAPGHDLGKPAESPDAEDLARTLQQGETEPVSRVMGQRIVASAVKPYIHGTFAIDWRWGDGELQIPNTLDLRESHLYLGAHILDIAQPEVFLEVEKKNQTSEPLNLRYGQVDFKIAGDLLVLRAGLFLVPFGVYNTVLFLRYNAHLPERPDLHRRVVPGSWSEVGAQLRGRWEWAPGRALQYYAYVTNGQEGTLTLQRATYDPVYRSLSGAKSVGARVTVQPLDGLTVGLSGYRGALNAVDGGLVLGAADFIYRNGPFSADGEGMYGYRLDPTGPIPEGGFYAAAGYKIVDAVEAVVGAGGLTVGPTEQEHELDVTVGVNVFPIPDRFPTAVLKAAYERDLGDDPGNGVTIMFAIGF